MAIILKDLQFSSTLTLDKAYLRIDRVAGDKQEGYWNLLASIYVDKETAQKSLQFNVAIPFEDGNPVKLGYQYLKQAGVAVAIF